MSYNYNPHSVPSPVPQQNIPIVQSIPQQQNIQPLFPQPQGNVYSINSSLEMANVPVGAGISIALCMPENVMYIKAIQNGNPLLYPFKLVPFNQSLQPQEEVKDDKPSFEDQLKECNSKIEDLEEKLQKLLKKKGDDWNI